MASLVVMLTTKNLIVCCGITDSDDDSGGHEIEAECYVCYVVAKVHRISCKEGTQQKALRDYSAKGSRRT